MFSSNPWLPAETLGEFRYSKLVLLQSDYSNASISSGSASITFAQGKSFAPVTTSARLTL